LVQDIKNLGKKLPIEISNKFNIKKKMHKYVGFIGFETKQTFMSFKIKDIENLRSTGFRCDQAGKQKIIHILNNLENSNIEKTKENVDQLSIYQEFLLRLYNKQQRDNKIWFLDTETAIINEFEKKEK